METRVKHASNVVFAEEEPDIDPVAGTRPGKIGRTDLGAIREPWRHRRLMWWFDGVLRLSNPHLLSFFGGT